MNETKDNDFAARCRTVRKKVGVTAEQMSRVLLVSYSTYRSWESGTHEPAGERGHQARCRIMALAKKHGV